MDQVSTRLLSVEKVAPFHRSLTIPKQRNLAYVMNDREFFWPSFCIICVCVLTFIFFAGLLDRKLLAKLIETGGAVESLPFAVLVLAGFISIVMAFRTNRPTQWLCFCAFCLFIAGEESAWGAESVFGWTPLPERAASNQSDFHNSIASGLSHQLFGGADLNVPEVVWYAIYGAIIAFAGGFLILSLLLGMIGWNRFAKSDRLRCLRIQDASLQFFIAGFGLMFFANLDFFQGSGLAYMPGVWPLEETYELLGSIAFLYVPLVKFR